MLSMWKLLRQDPQLHLAKHVMTIDADVFLVKKLAVERFRAEKREGGAVGGRGQQDAGLCPRGACRRPSLTALRPAVQVGRQRFGQAEDAVRLIEGRPQEGAHRHQR